MNKEISVAACIFSSNRKKVLLIKRRDVPVWVLPGGGVEKLETPEKAILREVLEETGYKTKILKKIGEYTPINKLSKFTYLFECKILSGEKTLSKETKGVKFFDIKKLPKLIPPPYTEWIMDGHSNKNFILKKKLKEITYFALFKNFLLHPILVIRFILARLGLRINS
jgi:8-oxo-dGTP pyrophosphatase MutT (NUDIX family)